MRRRVISLLLLPALLLAACRDSSSGGGDTLIVLGEGVDVGGTPVRFGDARATVEAGLGAVTTTHDLGEAGVQLWYAEHQLTVMLDAGGAVGGIRLAEGFAGRTADGLGLGSTAAEVEAVLGVAKLDPFLGTRLYPTQGVAVTVDGGVVVGISLAAP